LAAFLAEEGESRDKARVENSIILRGNSEKQRMAATSALRVFWRK